MNGRSLKLSHRENKKSRYRLVSFICQAALQGNRMAVPPGNRDMHEPEEIDRVSMQRLH